MQAQSKFASNVTNLVSQSLFILNNDPILKCSLSSCMDLMLGNSIAAGETLASRLCPLSSLAEEAEMKPGGTLIVACCCVSSIDI